MLLRLIRELLGANSRRDGALQSVTREGHPADEWLRRGRALEKGGEVASALECYRACAAAHPDSPEAHLALAAALSTLWRMEECTAALDAALRLAPHNREIFSGVLLTHHYAAHPDSRALFELHRRYGQMASERLPPRVSGAHPHTRDAERPLRIGYLSRNFSRHSVGYFIEPVIARHDRTRYSVYCYYTHPYCDETTQRIARMAQGWRHVTDGSDESLADKIVDDGIDILVDLGGHTKMNRLGVFALKPAPVQMTWLGYPDTTGLAAIDYRITDAIAGPAPSADERHTERLLRLAPSFLCYQPPQDSPALAARGAPERVVFGSFNMLPKVNARVIGLWAGVLDAVPDSRLILKSASLEHAATASRVLACFAARGITGSRIELRGWAAGRAEHLAAYGEIDIALDTFPYNGTTTTCEALWMGVPVVTLAGEMHMSRVGATLLAAAGLGDLVAASAEGYVEIAARLARDVTRRQTLRRELRARLAVSPLLDHAGFVVKLEQLLRAAWRAWCDPWRR